MGLEEEALPLYWQAQHPGAAVRALATAQPLTNPPPPLAQAPTALRQASSNTCLKSSFSGGRSQILVEIEAKEAGD